MSTILPTHVAEAVPLGAVELPGMLNYHHDIDSNLSSGASTAGAALASILNMAEGINVARKSADPTVTRAAFLAKIEKTVAAFDRDATAKLNSARKALAASLKEAETKLANAVNISPSTNAAEVRSIFRAMPAGQRQAELTKAFRTGDKEVIGALVGFGQLMHGCNSEAIAALTDEYKRTVAPIEYASVQNHSKYQAYLDNAGPSLMAFTARAYKGTNGYEKKRQATEAVLRSYGIEFEA